VSTWKLIDPNTLPACYLGCIAIARFFTADRYEFVIIEESGHVMRALLGLETISKLGLRTARDAENKQVDASDLAPADDALGEAECISLALKYRAISHPRPNPLWCPSVAPVSNDDRELCVNPSWWTRRRRSYRAG